MLFAVVGLAAPAQQAWADDGYTITVSNAQPGQTYTLYKLFDATTTADRQQSSGSSSTSGIAYSYSLSGTKPLTTSYSYTDASGTEHSVQGDMWFEQDSAGNVKAKESTTDDSLATEDFRQWAKQFGEQTGEAQTVSSTSVTTLTFDNLSDGYYFLTTTTGTLVTVTSVAPNQTVRDKNTAPDVSKAESVKTSNVGDQVTYTVKISIPVGQSKVVLHDALDSTMTLVDQKTDGSNNYELKVENGGSLTETTDYTVDYWSNTDFTSATGNTTSLAGDNITISFTSSYLNKITDRATLVLTYTATLSNTAGINMKNTAWVTYGENNTPSTKSDVYESTFGFQITKLDSGNNSALSGAKFVLSKNGGLGNLTEDTYSTHSNDLLSFNNGGLYEKDATNYLLTANNTLQFKGLNNDEDNGTLTYYLYEVTAPNGYNKLTAPIQIQITPTHSDQSSADQGTQVTGYTVQYRTSDTEQWATANAANGNTIQASDLTTMRNINVGNAQGVQLPTTGGPGTVLMYIIGAALVIAAGVALIVRRKMRKN